MKAKQTWINCSEQELESKIAEWLNTVSISNSILFLEGEMGAGKSTWVRALLRTLAPEVKSQGSPTFPLVTEYQTKNQNLYHIDLYRLKSEAELEDSGLLAQIEEQGSIACIEWGSQFEEAFSYWLDSSRKRQKSVFLIEIEDQGQGLRNYRISEI